MNKIVVEFLTFFFNGWGGEVEALIMIDTLHVVYASNKWWQLIYFTQFHLQLLQHSRMY